MINPFKASAELISVNIKNSSQTFSMAWSELKKSFGGTLFGSVWTVVKPLVFIFVYWFTMSIGIRGNKPVVTEFGKYPYIVWMLPGLIAWFLFSDVLSHGVICIRKNSHLVNKMVFPVGTIPVFTVISCCFSHIILIFISFIIMLINGHTFDIHLLQLLFYIPVFFIFNCVVATFISTISVISRDFEQLVKAIMNIFFWLTPVLWQTNKLNGALATAMKLNPFYFFVMGYRDAMLGETWFWEHPLYLLYMFVFIGGLGLLSASLFKKLSPEFADVL